MTDEKKDFEVKDKRSLDDSANVNERVNSGEEKVNSETAGRQAQGHEEEKTAPPLPEINFTSLIFSLSSSAFFHLGEIADPQTGKMEKDLPLAKQTIDTIAMLKEKTEGNLTEEEKKFLVNALTDLRWRYVECVKEGGD